MIHTEWIRDKAAWFYACMTPPPVSPLFKEGGALEGFNEDAVFLALVMLLLAAVDHCIARPFVKEKVRYFFLHAVTNAVVVAASLPDMYRALTVHPHDAFTGPAYTVVGNNAMLALHFYHCVAFDVTADDVFHHVAFVLALGAWAIPLKQVVGVAMATTNFFLSGLPGGVEYVLLCLVAHGRMEKATEKRLFAALNVWLRAPGAVWCCALGYATYAAGNVTYVPAWVAAAAAALCYYNGAYYSGLAVESCARFEYAAAARKQASNKKPATAAVAE